MADILSEAASLSHFSFFWGYLAESTITKNQRTLHVYVPALTPMRNGDVTEKGSTTTVDVFNVMTQSREISNVHLSRTIEAEYLGFQSGREVPDMYKGQQVLVINYARGDHWFWVPLDRDDYVKTFEHTRLRCADIGVIHKTLADGKVALTEDQERQQALDDDNTYFLEIDTKYHKRILLSTAASDGEKYRYFIRMDAKDHILELWDSISSKDGKTDNSKPHNTIRIESDPKTVTGSIMQGRITVQNEAGTTLLLEDKDMKVIVPQDLTINVGRNVITHVNGSSSTTVGGNMHLKVIGDAIRDFMGILKTQVLGLYSLFCKTARVEETVLTYTLKTRGLQTNMFGARVTTIDSTDVETAQQITVTANAQMLLTGSQQVSLSTSRYLTFSAKRITTNTHIYGCCSCKGH